MWFRDIISNLQMPLKSGFSNNRFEFFFIYLIKQGPSHSSFHTQNLSPLYADSLGVEGKSHGCFNLFDFGALGIRSTSIILHPGRPWNLAFSSCSSPTHHHSWTTSCHLHCIALRVLQKVWTFPPRVHRVLPFPRVFNCLLTLFSSPQFVFMWVCAI